MNSNYLWHFAIMLLIMYFLSFLVYAPKSEQKICIQLSLIKPQGQLWHTIILDGQRRCRIWTKTQLNRSFTEFCASRCPFSFNFRSRFAQRWVRMCPFFSHLMGRLKTGQSGTKKYETNWVIPLTRPRLSYCAFYERRKRKRRTIIFSRRHWSGCVCFLLKN